MGNFFTNPPTLLSGDDANPYAVTPTILCVAVGSAAAYGITIRRKLPSTSSLSKFLFEDLPLHILTHHRSAVVTVFGLPLSLAWDASLALRSSWIRFCNSAPHLHDQRVRDIVQQVKASPQGSPLCTARPGWMSVSLSYRTYKSKWRAVQMPLYDILNIDEEKRIIHVEPLVSTGQLTRALLPLGLTLPIVPEMDDLTVGGLINGTGIESSSHRYGLFHEIVVEMELCLGDGTVVVATADNSYSDLFHAVPWSYGTLALLLSAKLRLIPCKPWVRLTYEPFHERGEYIQRFRLLSGETLDDDASDEAVAKTPMFVEGLAYSRNEAVIMSGEFIDASSVPRSQTNRLSLWYKPWFYKHVEEILRGNCMGQGKGKQVVVEYIPLRDYYHRHTQSLFWEMELMIPVGNHPLFRYLFGWLMPPKVSFLKISQTEMTRQLTERTHVAQDFLVSTRKMEELLDVCDEQFDRIYPLWLCPHKHGSMPGSLLRDPTHAEVQNNFMEGIVNGNEHCEAHEMYVDIGVYGLPQCVKELREEEFNMTKSMRAVLDELVRMNGFQMLYADVYSKRDEFEKMFDHTGYRRLREKYGATKAFKEVYDKMNVRVVKDS